MFRISALLGLAFLVVGLVVGTTSSGEKKEKIKGTLPAGWKDLDLSIEQKGKIYSIQTDYRVKILDLEKKIKELRSKEFTELLKVLTAEQRKELQRKLDIDKGTTKESKAPSKSTEK